MHHQRFVIMFVLSTALFFAIGCGNESPPPQETVTTTFKVAGMTCESCDAAINHTVGELDGVTAVEAHYDPGEATVTYNAGTVSAEEIGSVIEGLGYTIVSP